MPFVKGAKHSAEARRKMSEKRRGIPHSEDRKAKISAANKGRVPARVHERQCACGAVFMSARPAAIFCSVRCRRASYGHGLRHAPAFAHFAQRCAVCESTDQLVGDHNHVTGAPRGILCRNCNLAVGNMRDNPNLLRRAAAYLEEQAP